MNSVIRVVHVHTTCIELKVQERLVFWSLIFKSSFNPMQMEDDCLT